MACTAEEAVGLMGPDLSSIVLVPTQLSSLMQILGMELRSFSLCTSFRYFVKL